jgi:hypothetical protein
LKFAELEIAFAFVNFDNGSDNVAYVSRSIEVFVVMAGESGRGQP